VGLALLLLSTSLAGAEESGEATPPDELDRAAALDASSGSEASRQLLWSTTVFGQLKGIHSSQDDDGLGGFFDQYEFTPNKDNSVALELGVREASFDWIEEGGALLQLRYESPTSNLGVTGSDVDNSFFNQRALLLGRTDAFQLDLDYRRLRTEQLRIYPETVAGGAALPFTDLAGEDNRFYRERTGFQAELRWRPDATLDGRSDTISWLAPELSFRGGYDARDSQRQIRTILNPGNDWLALSEQSGDEVGDVGLGVLVAPGGRFTLTVDYDHQEFSGDNARTDDGLPFASISRSIGFVPSSERNTGSTSLHARIADRAVVKAGFQASVVDQDSPKTPAQRAAGFNSNDLIVLSSQLSGDVQIASDLSANAFVKYVYRDHDLDEGTLLFDPDNGSQVDPFLETFHRVDLGGEVIYRPDRKLKLALGARLLHIDRDLDFATAGLGNRVILPENALVNDETTMWTIYGRADLRPRRGLGIRTELSYRDAPDTGYVTDLDGYFLGKLRASYVLPTTRPATLALHLRGGKGSNSDFAMVQGLGPNPPGPSVKRDYERSHWSLSLSGDVVLREDTTLFASLFYAQDEQSDDLLLSDVQRYFQEAIPLTFRSQGGLDFQSDELGLVLGSQVWLSEQLDAGLSYSFTRAEADYGDSGSARALQLIDDNRVVDADIHAFDLELRHQLREGLRLFAGYRIQYFSDGAPKPNSPGSSRQPPDRSDIRHTVSFGVTLNGELFRGRR
jgi:hypothetical protein